jgi:3-hydroxy acid dehydrogenase / malonic semialdehyde reductase
MASIRNHIALITGATSGIGLSCARALAEEGVHLIVAARRKALLDDIAADIAREHVVRVLAVELDVRDRDAVAHAVETLPEEWRAIDMLVNNAGVPRGLEKLYVGSTDDWDEMIDTNVKGLLYVTRAVVPGMVARGRGHIINIGSIAGHEAYPNGAVYNASKFAVDAITKSLRMDLVDTPLRVSTVDPGMVKTNFSVVRFHGDEQRADKVYENIEPLTGDDVAQAVVFCATRPPHVSVNQIVIMPTAQASATIVHRGPLAG